MGRASPPLIEYCSGKERGINILIPGAGNAHEWSTLNELGFKNVTVLDLSPLPIERLREQFPSHEDHFIVGDFFDHEETYDLIIEQTFFCAIDPSLRKAYVDKMSTLLYPKGTVAGVLFAQEFEKEGPPYGGKMAEYEHLFLEKFIIHILEPCRNSIPPRAGKELFLEMSLR